MTSSPDKKEYHLDEVMPLFRQRLAEGNRVRFGPKGVSMLPMIRQGIDSVELGPLPEKLKKFDLPLYQRRDGNYVLHRIVGVGDTYTCIGDNQFRLEKGLTHDQMIGLVVAFYRGEKRWDVEQWQYKLYCRVWHYTRFPRKCWRGLRARVLKLLKKKSS